MGNIKKFENFQESNLDLEGKIENSPELKRFLEKVEMEYTTFIEALDRSNIKFDFGVTDDQAILNGMLSKIFMKCKINESLKLNELHLNLVHGYNPNKLKTESFIDLGGLTKSEIKDMLISISDEGYTWFSGMMDSESRYIIDKRETPHRYYPHKGRYIIFGIEEWSNGKLDKVITRTDNIEWHLDKNPNLKSNLLNKGLTYNR